MFRAKLTLNLTFTIWPWPVRATIMDYKASVKEIKTSLKVSIRVQKHCVSDTPTKIYMKYFHKVMNIKCLDIIILLMRIKFFFFFFSKMVLINIKRKHNVILWIENTSFEFWLWPLLATSNNIREMLNRMLKIEIDILLTSVRVSRVGYSCSKSQIFPRIGHYWLKKECFDLIFLKNFIYFIS